ncbi:hypothetical protein [Halomarina litorea]|uniref:hypothetical protein n=1 Tax=Halomarina litorea TaxID=2961595 RepID=UPI0020C3DD0F|nr:hypothetical protein [Halomarina sp. BCD28]
MNPRTKSSLLWGLVSALSFLVLAQGYQLFDVGRLPLAGVAIGTVVVFAGAALLTYLVGL